MAKKVVYIHLGLSPNIIWHHDGAWVGVVSFQHPMHTLCINVVRGTCTGIISVVRALHTAPPSTPHPRPHTIILHIPHAPHGSRHFADFPDGSDNMFLLPRSLAVELQPTG